MDPIKDMLGWVPDEDEALEPPPPEADIRQVNPGQVTQTRVLGQILSTISLDIAGRRTENLSPNLTTDRSLHATTSDPLSGKSIPGYKAKEAGKSDSDNLTDHKTFYFDFLPRLSLQRVALFPD